MCINKLILLLPAFRTVAAKSGCFNLKSNIQHFAITGLMMRYRGSFAKQQVEQNNPTFAKKKKSLTKNADKIQSNYIYIYYIYINLRRLED